MSEGRDYAVGARLVQEGHRFNREGFRVLVSLGVFNSALMNDAVFKFKRYEDSSLSYTGIDKHGDEDLVSTTP